MRTCCRTCGDELRVPFACKSRGFCPSCMGRRMAENTALLVDHVLPAVGYRQWVLSFPVGYRQWVLSFTGPLAQRRCISNAPLRTYRSAAQRLLDHAPGLETPSAQAHDRLDTP